MFALGDRLSQASEVRPGKPATEALDVVDVDPSILWECLADSAKALQPMMMTEWYIRSGLPHQGCLLLQ